MSAVVEAIRSGSTPGEAFDAARQLMLRRFRRLSASGVDQAHLLSEIEGTRKAMDQLRRIGGEE